MTHLDHPAWEPAYARRSEGMKASEIRELLKLLDQPGIISFAGGIPDPKLFPGQAAAQAYGDALATPKSTGVALQYSVSEGYGPLTDWVARRMTAQGVPATLENIVITSGSQQALDFLGKLLLTPGDTALTAVPTYLGALQAFSAYRAALRHDQSGARQPHAAVLSRGASGAPGPRSNSVIWCPISPTRPAKRCRATHGSARSRCRASLIFRSSRITAYCALRFDGVGHAFAAGARC